jgi:hypothetical protein
MFRFEAHRPSQRKRFTPSRAEASRGPSLTQGLPLKRSLKHHFPKTKRTERRSGSENARSNGSERRVWWGCPDLNPSKTATHVKKEIGRARSDYPSALLAVKVSTTLAFRGGGICVSK